MQSGFCNRSFWIFISTNWELWGCAVAPFRAIRKKMILVGHIEKNCWFLPRFAQYPIQKQIILGIYKKIRVLCPDILKKRGNRLQKFSICPFNLLWQHICTYIGAIQSKNSVYTPHVII